MNNNKLIFLKWLPASGKSTWAKEYVRSHPNAIRVNKDDLRAMMNDSTYSKSKEEFVKDSQMKLVTMAIGRWYDTIIVDNTHLAGTHEDDYRTLIENYNLTGGVQWEFQVKEFHTDVDECVRRDALRWDKKVWEKVIRDMSRQAKWGIPLRSNEFEVVPMDSSLPKAIIVDIDWTIAKMEGRSPYDYSRVMEDSVHEDVVSIINSFILWRAVLKEKIHYIIVSWRKDECKLDTIKWLKDKNLGYDELHMRKADDNRKDSQVKYEILLDLKDRFNILAVFDDRDQVVKMWRQAWLRCFQVADGNF